MKRRMILTAVLMASLMLVSAAQAAGKVTISIVAEKDVTVGKEIKRVPVKNTVSGDTIIYTITYKNSGNETATNAIVDDPISHGTNYISCSAFGANSDISFSIDKGKTFKKPSLLTYDVKLPNGKTEKRTASTEDYTNIRWEIKSIAPGASGQVGFKVYVK